MQDPIDGRKGERITYTTYQTFDIGVGINIGDVGQPKEIQMIHRVVSNHRYLLSSHFNKSLNLPHI